MKEVAADTKPGDMKVNPAVARQLSKIENLPVVSQKQPSPVRDPNTKSEASLLLHFLALQLRFVTFIYLLEVSRPIAKLSQRHGSNTYGVNLIVVTAFS